MDECEKRVLGIEPDVRRPFGFLLDPIDTVLNSRTGLVQEAEGAIAERAAAQEREAAASRRVVRRTLAGLAAALILAALAGGFGWYALQQKSEAEANASRAAQSAEAASSAQKDAETRRGAGH
jgi:uncharacterized protein HemX